MKFCRHTEDLHGNWAHAERISRAEEREEGGERGNRKRGFEGKERDICYVLTCYGLKCGQRSKVWFSFRDTP